MKKEMIEVDVHIPSADGQSGAYIEKALVPAVFDQDYILDDDALKIIENLKVRRMGLYCLKRSRHFEPDWVQPIRRWPSCYRSEPSPGRAGKQDENSHRGL